eukprot:scaffold1.g5369.t1
MARFSCSWALVAVVAAALASGAFGDWSDTAPVVGLDTSSLTGSVYDIACPCGFVTDFEVFANPDTKAMADIRVKCSPDAGVYVSGPGPALASGAAANYAAAGSNADGFHAVGATAVLKAISFDSAGDELDCGADYIVGLQVEAYVDPTRSDTQEIINIKGSCAAKDDVPCSGAPPADCQPGYVRDANSQQCEACPAGTIEVNGDCQYCPAGTAQDQPGSTQCKDCQPGTWTESEGADVCDEAPVGAIASTTASSSITWCPPGTVANDAGTQCVDCPPGYWRAGDASPNANACARLPPGWRTLIATRASAVALCAASSVSYWGDESIPTSWSAGDPIQTSRVPSDPSACDACAGNKFAALDGSAACTTCRGGFAPDASHTTCNACAPLTYKPFDDPADSCLKCGPGKETGFVSGAQACTDCVPGFVNPSQTATGTTSQYPGIDVATYLSIPPDASLGISPTCLSCPKNWYQDEAGKGECKRCPAGMGTESVGASVCDACPLGSYSASAESPCVLAPAGTFVNITGATSTTPCAVGTYASDAGNDACDACPAGMFAPQTGSTACTNFPGTYSTAGSRQCLPCRPGTFAKNAGQGKCTPAPAGSFAAGAGNKRATVCPKGSFQDKTGKAACTKCTIDTYQALTGKTTCSACCQAGTVLGQTCFLWTRGKTGAAKCDATRVRPGTSL